MRRLYEPLYRLMATLRIPKTVVFGSAVPLLDRLLDEGRLPGGRAIDLGCGVGTEAVLLARRGFDVTGVDFSPTAVRLARRRAAADGVDVEFIVDDLTRLRHVHGTFDLLVDIGTLNDIRGPDRDRYLDNVVPLARTGSRFVLFGFARNLSVEELTARFSAMFTIETLEDRTEPLFRRRMITSLLTRRSNEEPGTG